MAKTTMELDVEVKKALGDMGKTGQSYNEVLKKVIEDAKLAREMNIKNMKTAIVDNHGKASISRTLAGKTIEYRVKQ
ncbi:MAG: hypothetical protein OIN84_20555 [Candidatus Methanoperedens sp.]|nr:hypothetical protein [Candidatus Methanoperedens sp. BLZ2]KAB2942418.1 MAG: hypothetical protein F9K14_17365 [Candidatus Methanoperedens sp.]MBZ0176640.1 hypothetical protein [Candidatus Methanoperedens nitroreducens]MCX9080364.1 hypothetical protein [Candidatus Methanoperedens sp.]